MLSFNVLVCKEFGTTQTKWRQKKKKWFWSNPEMEQFEKFIPSEEYIIVDNNKICPTIIAHPDLVGTLIKRFTSLPNYIKCDITCENGEPVRWTTWTNKKTGQLVRA